MSCSSYIWYTLIYVSRTLDVLVYWILYFSHFIDISCDVINFKCRHIASYTFIGFYMLFCNSYIFHSSSLISHLSYMFAYVPRRPVFLISSHMSVRFAYFKSFRYFDICQPFAYNFISLCLSLSLSIYIYMYIAFLFPLASFPCPNSSPDKYKELWAKVLFIALGCLNIGKLLFLLCWGRKRRRWFVPHLRMPMGTHRGGGDADAFGLLADV